MTARRTAEFLAALAAFTALTALFFWQTLPHLSSALLGPAEDNLQDFWNSWYAAQGHQGAFFFTRLIRAPEGVWLYYHSFAYPQIAAVWGLSRIFGTSLPTLVLLQNLTILASFPLAATSAFYLCRHLGGGLAGSAVGGFVFAFSPWHVAQAMHHAHVAGIEFLPAFVLCYLLASERKSFAWLAGAIAFYALSALSCWYFLFYCFYFLLFHLLYLRVHEQQWPRGWRLTAPALCLAGTALLLSPLLLPMMQNGLHDGAYLRGSDVFEADLLGYTAFPPTHFLAEWSRGLYNAFTGNNWEDTVYLGIVNLALLVWGFWRAHGGERRILWYALGGMAFFAVLASGDTLHWGGRALPVHTPGLVLSHLPYFANIRTPVRAIVFVYLFLGIATAMATAAILKTGRSAPAGAMLAFAAFLVLLDFFPVRLQTTAMNCAPDLAVLAKDVDRTSGVLDLPFGYLESNFYMAQQACHGRSIVRGSIARQLTPTLADRLDVRDLAAQRRELQSAKIKFVLLHHPKDGMFKWNTRTDGEPGSYRNAYTILSDTPDMTILRVD